MSEDDRMRHLAANLSAYYTATGKVAPKTPETKNPYPGGDEAEMLKALAHLRGERDQAGHFFSTYPYHLGRPFTPENAPKLAAQEGARSSLKQIITAAVSGMMHRVTHKATRNNAARLSAEGYNNPFTPRTPDEGQS